MSLNNRIKTFLHNQGVLKVGFATKDSLKGGPSTVDFTYSLLEGKSVVCFALPLDKEKIRAFLRKDLPNGRRGHELDNIETNIHVFKIAIKLTDYLNSLGYKAKPIFPNYKYREDVPGWEINMIPELSLKLIAARSGVGSIGLSGNLGLKGYGATIILGGVVTDALLQATDPIPQEESFCNECRLCQKVCAFRMFGTDEMESIDIGGYTFSCAKRINLTRCQIVCGGLSGLDKSGQWSTWSPGRYDYPETDKEVMRLLAIAVNNSSKWPDDGAEIGMEIANLEEDEELSMVLGNDKEKLFTMIKNTKLTCGNCQLICWGYPKLTKENFEILTNSGCIVQNETGEILVLSPNMVEKVFSKMNPEHQRLYYKKIRRF